MVLVEWLALAAGIEAGTAQTAAAAWKGRGGVAQGRDGGRRLAAAPVASHKD